MIFWFKSRIKNQKSESMIGIWLESNFESRIKNQKSESMRFFFWFRLVYLDLQIWKSTDLNLSGWKKNMEKINFHIMPKGFPEKFSFRDSNLL